ncbi:triple tyrosine motif-containing protein [Winogradskyella wichelsiae]|uniref:triple tyrosine motif-containing protein n=1 Tax=Winogradskyella wichelsiae TaxID=2697007 RepID=UPI003EF956EC
MPFSNKFRINLCFLCVALFFNIIVDAQEVPPIQIFTPQDYNAEDQNWAISQSDDNFIYVANNKGLLEYDGASWKLYASRNEGILRSVKVSGDKIYSGGYMDFGYWIKDKQGLLKYTSLSKSENLIIKEDEEFWGIIVVDGYVLFQSFESIYIYNTDDESYDVIDSNYRINKMFKVDNTIYFQKTGYGIFKIEDGRKILVVSIDQIGNIELINVFKSGLGLLFQTKDKGFYYYKDGVLELWNKNIQDTFAHLSVYSSIRLKDGTFILGTIANGMLHVDQNGKELLKLDQSLGLSNNTILSIMEDSFGNVWLGLDNGINVINLKSPYKVYTDKQGVLGAVYTAAKKDGLLYLGTNQGLFYKPIDVNGKFTFIEGTKGQVWNLSILKNELFCGHDKGTFIINGTAVQQVSSEIGTWIIKEVKDYPNLLVQGNYKGINVLEKVNGTWHYRNTIEGFNISSRYIEFLSSRELLVNHEYKGVYKVELDTELREVLNYEKLPMSAGIKSCIVNYDNRVLYSYKEGVFEFKRDRQKFEKDTLLSDLLNNDNYVSGKLFSDVENNRLWVFSKNDITYVEPGKFSSDPKINVIGISNEVRKSKSGFENMLDLGDYNYLIGTTEGYLTVDLSKIEHRSLDMHLNNVQYGSHPNELTALDLKSDEVFKNETNNVKFQYSITNYSMLSNSKYQYRLIGIYNKWSDWSSNSEAFFENLPYGEYTFQARALSNGIPSANNVSFSFAIDKPWYFKPLAIISYVVLSILVLYVLYFFNKKHYKKEQQKLLEKKERQLKLEQLENQRQLIQFKNTNLQLDIENKNRELGMATMNLVKRNELLSNIKDELSKRKSLNEVDNVIKLINSSINNTGDWQLFEEAFNNVDKDFMKKIKALHPSITASDLRLCAYLRLNLSSKEIAPLLNISHKSVEVKRYRLRKKLELDHDHSLSSYIIEL